VRKKTIGTQTDKEVRLQKSDVKRRILESDQQSFKGQKNLEGIKEEAKMICKILADINKLGFSKEK